MQFTFELSPFFGQGCVCDCCSLAARELSFLPEPGVSWELDRSLLEDCWLLEDRSLLEGEAAEDGVAGAELDGVVCACAAAQMRQAMANAYCLPVHVGPSSLASSVGATQAAGGLRRFRADVMKVRSAAISNSATLRAMAISRQ